MQIVIVNSILYCNCLCVGLSVFTSRVTVSIWMDAFNVQNTIDMMQEFETSH
jgi:hypothetical protein